MLPYCIDLRDFIKQLRKSLSFDGSPASSFTTVFNTCVCVCVTHRRVRARVCERECVSFSHSENQHQFVSQSGTWRKMFPRNGTTGQIEQSSHDKSLAGKEVRWAMKIESRRGTTECGMRLDEDHQKRRCVNTGIVWQELENKSANKHDESM